MPLKKDPAGGGTETDGTKSLKYCGFCYQNGIFLSPEIDTPEKMQVFCVAKLKEMGFPGFVAKFFTRVIPKLERWKK